MWTPRLVLVAEERGQLGNIQVNKSGGVGLTELGCWRGTCVDRDTSTVLCPSEALVFDLGPT